MNQYVALLALTAWAYGAAAEARQLPTPCPTARYVVTQGATELGGTTTDPVVVVMADQQAILSGGCPATRTRVRVRRSGTRLLTTFASCGSLTNIRVRATLPPTCDAITGTLRAKKTKRIVFTASRSRCGDQIVDAGNGEECDATSCSGDRTCSACGCTIDGGGNVCTTTVVPTTPWIHIAIDSAVPETHNPPTSGPHYPVWAHYEAFTATVPRGYWIHNLEHGAVILLYRPDADGSLIAALQSAYTAIPIDPSCGHRRALITPDPLLDRPFVVVAANVELACPAVDTQAILDFVAAHRGHGPENVCANGSYSPG